MPGRLRNPPASNTADAEDEMATNLGPGKLRFRDSLSWRAGRAIPVAELLKSLKKLADEFKEHEQGAIDLDDLVRVAQELAGAHLLAHKDRGVRAWTAVCIVDVLMHSAPNATFKVGQLRDIFTTFITSIIPALADPSNAYNREHIYVLHSLAEYQSIILLTDIDAADSLILSLFTACFDIISNSSKASTGEELVKNVEFDMTRLLVTIIDEVPSLNPEVVDIIIVQFLRVDPGTASQMDRKSKKQGLVDSKQDTLGFKEYPPAYNMAKAICSSCPEKMTNHISTYFNNIIIDASESFPQPNGSSKHSHKRHSNLDEMNEDNEDLQQLRKAHKLIRELWRACPDVLHNVIPQVEAELGADSIPLRVLATETLGDVAAGIGVAGLPPIVQPDPAAWPPLRMGQRDHLGSTSPLTTPMSPKPFSQTHASAYDSFLTRCHDKSSLVRATWATGVGRILLTSGGGLGLDMEEERKLVIGLAGMLSDAEEKVRIATVEAVGQFGFTDTVNRLAKYGGMSDEGSLLAQLAERLKDKRIPVREAAFEVLGRKWGVAAFEIEQGSEAVRSALGQIPQQILNSFFTNDPEIHLLLDKTIFEQMIPLSFPPIKADSSKSTTQRKRAVEPGEDQATLAQTDPDQIRLRRILTLLRDIDEKGRKVFQHLMQRQVKMIQIMTAYLQSCEDFNGGVVENGEADIKGRLTKIIELISKTMPESTRVSADLWKFAKNHDRRNYQLIRFAMAAESDYRTVIKAIKELTKRVQTGPAGSASILETLMPLLYRCSLLFLNRSHIPAVIEISRNDEHGLSAAAHELLKTISSLCPAVLKTQILDMCKDLETNAPSDTQSENVGAADTLKACAGFARKFPKEIPTDRRFQVAMTNYALFSSSPRAAKHAVTILMQTAPKKEMYAKDLIARAVKDFSVDSPHALASLATIAQINLLAPTATDQETDAITEIVFKKVLLHKADSKSYSEKEYVWSEEPSMSVTLKEWALKILINRLRSYPEENTDVALPSSSIREVAEPTYRILNLLISNQGELHESNSTPPTERPRLRLIAAKLLLKLCSHRRICEELVNPKDFNSFALITQDRLPPLRKAIVDHLKKYLSANRLASRWYTILFILAFEPDPSLRVGTSLWLKNQSQQILRVAKSQAAANGKSHYQNVVELLFARLLSLLAHHPDYPTEDDGDEYVANLCDFTRYIIFYLTSVSNEDSLSLIFHIAQRVKQARDGITDSEELEDVFSERLYILSDLSQTVIRIYADILSTTKGHEKGVNLLQTWPGKLRLPATIFKPFSSDQRDLAITVAEKDFLAGIPEIKDAIEDLVKSYMKPSGASKSARKKRKTEDIVDEGDDEEEPVVKKKPKSTARLPIRKASKQHSSSTKSRKSDESRIEAEQPSRKSSRKSGATVSYADRDSSEDDMEMDEWDQKATEASVKSKGTPSSKVSRRNGSASAQIDDENDPDRMDVEGEGNGDETATPSVISKSTPSSSKRLNGNSSTTPASHTKANRRASTALSSSATKPKVKPQATKSKARRKRDTALDEDDAEEDDDDSVQDSKAAMSAAAKKHQAKLKTTPLKGKGKENEKAKIHDSETGADVAEEDTAAAAAEADSGQRRGGRTLRRARRG